MSKKLFDGPLFEGFPQSTRDFYTKIFVMMAMNDLAYRKGYFDVRLCDTHDPFSWFRFVEQMDDIKMWLQLDDDLGLEGPPKERL